MNEKTNYHSQVIKTDILGRVKVASEDREKMLDVFESSGMSAVAFAKSHGVKQQTFATWIQKRRRDRGDYENPEIRRKLRMRKKSQKSQTDCTSELPPLNFIELDVSPKNLAPSQTVEIVLPNGIVIKIQEGSQMGMLKTLVKELQC